MGAFDDITRNMTVKSHTERVRILLAALSDFHDAQEDTYRLSFAKRGEAGIYYNLVRKADRLDALSQSVFAGDIGGNDGKTLVDTLVDMCVYAAKWLAVIMEIRPYDVGKWITSTYVPALHMSEDLAMNKLGMVKDYNMLETRPMTEFERQVVLAVMAAGNFIPTQYSDVYGGDGTYTYQNITYDDASVSFQLEPLSPEQEEKLKQLVREWHKVDGDNVDVDDDDNADDGDNVDGDVV